MQTVNTRFTHLLAVQLHVTESINVRGCNLEMKIAQIHARSYVEILRPVIIRLPAREDVLTGQHHRHSFPE